MMEPGSSGPGKQQPRPLRLCLRIKVPGRPSWFCGQSSTPFDETFQEPKASRIFLVALDPRQLELLG